ncbi:MAG: NAD(P)-binding protein [Eubacteriales bacterium]|nr:NAD(P)-binding protein [Eubacteriales bacterium]
MDQFLKQFDQCRQWEKPFCTATCPFHMDVLDFQEKMARGSYNAAFKTFRNAVAFPDIVAALCPEYCASSCPRKDLDQAVQLNLLEKTCVAKATKKDPTDYNVPIKNRKIAVVGGGMSGLACALRLSSKKYDVSLYEKTDRLGGRLWELLPPALFLEDVRRQFQFENYSLHLNTEVLNIKELVAQGFEAIYIATGKGGSDFGVLGEGYVPYRLDKKTALFLGGSLLEKDPIHSIADGLDMAWAIEIYLKTGKMEYPIFSSETKAAISKDRLQTLAAIVPSNDGIFTDKESLAEASRCIRCQCDSCRTDCDLSAFYKKWPLKMRDEIMSTVSPSDSILHGTPAIRLINTCTDCRLFEESCPADIKFCEMLREARLRLHNLGKMPGAYHQFWLADMEHANGEFAALVKTPPHETQSNYAFFPGCQLGATDPRYVSETYRYLLSKDPQTGLLLRCCGVPAAWSGNEKRHAAEIASLKNDWERLGCPTLIIACPSCARELKEQLPEVATISLYEILSQGEPLWGNSKIQKKQDCLYSIFDPCSAKQQENFQTGVRELVSQCGIAIEELPNGDHHGCCGFGGHAKIANPAFGDYVAKQRSGLSENPYITYCINCRDIFYEERKPALHVLDLLFDLNEETGALPNLSERRKNRVQLKESLLTELWEEKMEAIPETPKTKLILTAEIQQKMNEQKLLEEDIINVLEFADSTGRRIFDQEKKTYTAFRELGYITCWVEYRPVQEGFEILNVYTHRITIELEMIWNGSKTDFDLR